jgi:hypothetical protein
VVVWRLLTWPVAGCQGTVMNVRRGVVTMETAYGEVMCVKSRLVKRKNSRAASKGQ